MDLTVIVPVYNVKDYLAECVESVLAQNVGDLTFEVLLVDDRSTDGSERLCEAWAERDPRVTVVRKPRNEGLGMARNTGLDCARGEWILFLDSDDWLAPNTLARLVSLAQRRSADLVSFGVVLAYPERYLWPSDTGAETEFDGRAALESLLSLGALTSSACDKLWRRTLFDTIRFSDTRFNEDTEIVYRLVHACQRVVRLDAALYMYRQRAGSLTQQPIAVERAEFNIRVAREQIAYCAERCPSLELLALERLFVKLFVLTMRVEPKDAPVGWHARQWRELRETWSRLERELPTRKRLLYGAVARVCGNGPLALLRPAARFYFASSFYRPLMNARFESRPR